MSHNDLSLTEAELEGLLTMWVSAERAEMKATRSPCRNALKHRGHVHGYWRGGKSRSGIDIETMRLVRDAMAAGTDPCPHDDQLEDL